LRFRIEAKIEATPGGLPRVPLLKKPPARLAQTGSETGVSKQSAESGGEFRRSLGDVGWVEGRCLSYGTATPYLLVLDLLRSHCGIGEADTPEAITEKIGRRVISGRQGTMVYWRMKAGAHATAHQHPQEQFVWVISGSIRFRIGAEARTIEPGHIAVLPGGVEHEAFFPEDTEVIDFFAPVREDFLTGQIPSYMAQR